MLEYGQHNFSLGKTDKQGVSSRAHLEQVAKSTGKTPPELIAPDFPDVAAHIWEAFMSLHSGRSYGMSGANPLSWGDIKAWVDLTGIWLGPWEIETIKALDLAWVRAMNESSDG